MPLVMSNSKSMFLHLPKTGGTWIRFALRKAGVEWEDYGLQHLNYADSSSIHPDSPRFTVLRDPFEWYASYWVMRQIEGWEANWILSYDCKHDDFNNFVQVVCLKHPGFLTAVYSEFAAPGVTVLRTETLRDDLIAYLHDAGEPFDEDVLRGIPLVHQGASLDEYRERVIYTDETRELLAESEKEIL